MEINLTEILKFYLHMNATGHNWATIDASQADVIRVDVGNINITTGAKERRILTRTYFKDGTYIERAHA